MHLNSSRLDFQLGGSVTNGLPRLVITNQKNVLNHDQPKDFNDFQYLSRDVMHYTCWPHFLFTESRHKVLENYDYFLQVSIFIYKNHEFTYPGGPGGLERWKRHQTMRVNNHPGIHCPIGPLDVPSGMPGNILLPQCFLTTLQDFVFFF